MLMAHKRVVYIISDSLCGERESGKEKTEGTENGGIRREEKKKKKKKMEGREQNRTEEKERIGKKKKRMEGKG